MWERMFDLVLGLKKEHRLMIVITLIYAVTLFGITVDVEAMENWLQLVGYTIRTLCIACIIQLSVFFLTNIFWKELNRGLNKTFVVISGNVLSLAFLLFPFSISSLDFHLRFFTYFFDNFSDFKIFSITTSSSIESLFLSLFITSIVTSSKNLLHSVKSLKSLRLPSSSKNK